MTHHQSIDDLLFDSRTTNGDWYDDELHPELAHIQELIDDLPSTPEEETTA